MQEIHSSNPREVTGICDPNKFRAQHHRSLKLGSKLKYINYIIVLTVLFFIIFIYKVDLFIVDTLQCTIDSGGKKTVCNET